jgi:hypothetical protein
VYRFWSKVNTLTQTPVNAVWLVVIFCSCLNLIGTGSPQTIVGIFSITAPALDLSYIAVIIAHRVYEHRVPFISGPYTMGRWSKPVNLVAVVWVLFISVVLFFPPIKPVTAANMNYAICVAGVIAIIAMSWWYLSAKKYVKITLLARKFAYIFQHIHWPSYERDPHRNTIRRSRIWYNVAAAITFGSTAASRLLGCLSNLSYRHLFYIACPP